MALLEKRSEMRKVSCQSSRDAAFFLIGRKNVPGALPQRSRVREILSFLSISPCREWQHPVGISRPNFTIFRYRASHSNSPRKKAN